MNIAFVLTPKQDVAFLYDDNTLRQGLEKLRSQGYRVIPVLDRAGKYVSTVSEGDFLWHIVGRTPGTLKAFVPEMAEQARVRDILGEDRNPPVTITATVEDILDRVAEQNFVPVMDDIGSFIGIVTRRRVMLHLRKNRVVEAE